MLVLVTTYGCAQVWCLVSVQASWYTTWCVVTYGHISHNTVTAPGTGGPKNHKLEFLHEAFEIQLVR